MQASPLEHPEVFSQFAFLISGYREEHVGWEFYVVMRNNPYPRPGPNPNHNPNRRKLGLLIIASAAPPSVYMGLRSFISAGIVGIAMVAHVRCKPYQRDDLNRVELAALATGAISLLCAQDPS